MAVPTQLAFRTSKGLGLLNASPVYEPLAGFDRPEGNIRCCVYSPDGRFFAWASPELVSVVDASLGYVVTTLPAENVFELGFSPLGTFIITWQRPSKDENGDAVKNLKVWKSVPEDQEEPEVVGRFVQKSQTGWNLQYTPDEEFCARAVTNEVQFYRSGDLNTVWNKLRVEGVTDFKLSPGKDQSVAVFIPERKGQPAAVKIFNVPDFASPVSQKTFFKGDKVELNWNNAGTGLIVLASTEVDKTNKSYYGETNMYLMSANGGFDARIQLDKEGPIHSVAWSPNSKEFGVVYGYMPAKSTIFNARAVALHNFPLGPRNTVLFSPHGRFVLVAGFGNLAGQVDIYDLEKDYARVTTIEASNSSICEWSPDGKHILTATTSPRLRVDNGIRVWHVGGGIMYNEEMLELYHVTWRPQSTMMHPLEDPLHPVPAPHPSAIDYLNSRKTPSKPVGAYRPPGARGTSTPLHFKREDEGGAAYVRDGISSIGTSAALNGFGATRRREVPGADPTNRLPPGPAPGGGVSLTGTGEGDSDLSKAALKNKKKREAKKAKEAAEKVASLAPSAADGLSGNHLDHGRSPERRDRRGHERSRSNTDEQYRNRSRARGHSQRRERDGSGAHGGPYNHNRQQSSNHIQQGQLQIKANALQVPVIPPAGPELTVTSPGGGSPEEKKIRALLKKLRAIDDLKMRQAAGEKLEDTQVKKINTEESVRKELDGLGYQG